MVVISIEKLEQLDRDKQNNIRHVALKIFAEKGYEDASTNQMVKEAGISKGTLFYYFDNKEGLFQYLVDYGLKIIQREYIEQMDYTTDDFIQRMENNSKIKYQYFQKYPAVNLFLSTALYKEFDRLSKKHQKKFKELIEYTKNEMSHQTTIREDLFKEDIDPKKASRIIDLSINGYFNELSQRYKQQHFEKKDIEHLWDDFEHFLDALREVFYKEFEEESQ